MNIGKLEDKNVNYYVESKICYFKSNQHFNWDEKTPIN